MALFEVCAITEHFLQVYNCKKLLHSVLRMKEHVKYEMHVQKKDGESGKKRGLDKVDEDDVDNSSLPAFKKVKRYNSVFHKVEALLSRIALTEMSRKMSRKDWLSPDQGERGGSVVERRTPEREVRGWKPTSAMLCP